MTQPNWKFREMTKGEMNADPFEGEFFSTEHLDSITDALVRETIQNSLDAGIPGKKVKVAFRLFSAESIIKGIVAPYLSGLEPHLNAKQNGLIETHNSNSPEEYLVVEDYGTNGLEGDPGQDDDQQHDGSQKNNFFYFWRNVGRSDKSEMDRGRWGLGKTVFQATSRINTFFGLTVRKSDALTLLMGQSVSKQHNIQQKKYAPYGWFGHFEENFCSPINDDNYIRKFVGDFNLQRLGNSGLSVVIPYPDKSITRETLFSSIVLHYFFPILSGELVVELSKKGKKNILINADILAKHFETICKFIKFSEQKTTKDNFKRLMSFAGWAHSLEASYYYDLRLPESGKKPSWGDIFFDPTVLANLQERFDQKERLAFRVHMKIQIKGQPAQKTFFEIFIERDDQLDKPEDHFVRDGITIAGVKSLRQKQVRALVLVQDKALSSLLGDSENPAHTEWQERSPKFKDKYDYGASCLRFVKNSPKELVSLLSKPKAGKDENLLRDIFYVDPPFSKGSDGSGSGNENSPGGPPNIPGLDRQVGEFKLTSIKGGFKVMGALDTKRTAKEITIEIAYETRGGNPFAKYHHLDFELGKPPISIKSSSVTITKASKNQLGVQIDDPHYVIEVKGFDHNRDIRVRVAPKRSEAND